jgi:hypothetical protein
MDPDPDPDPDLALFVSGLQNANNNFFSAYFFLLIILQSCKFIKTIPDFSGPNMVCETLYGTVPEHVQDSLYRK